MIQIKPILLLVLISTSTLAMHQEITRLKSNHLEAVHKKRKLEHPDDGSNILHMLARNRSVWIDESFVRELVRGGADINQKDIFDQTPLSIAAEENRLFLCKIFYACGAQDSAHEMYMSLLLQEHPRARNQIKGWFATRWFDEQRKKRLIAALLTLKTLHVKRINQNQVQKVYLPAEMQQKIGSFFDADCIPTHYLGQFFSKGRIKKIKKARLIEVQELQREFSRWKIR